MMTTLYYQIIFNKEAQRITIKLIKLQGIYNFKRSKIINNEMYYKVDWKLRKDGIKPK